MVFPHLAASDKKYRDSTDGQMISQYFSRYIFEAALLHHAYDLDCLCGDFLMLSFLTQASFIAAREQEREETHE